MNNKRTTYDKIEFVLREANRPLAPHDFRFVVVPGFYALDGAITKDPDGLRYVGCSESSLGRRLREMRSLSRITSQDRDGKAFKEFAIPSVVGALV